MLYRFLLLFILFIPGISRAEGVSLTSNYPSPAGYFSELRLYPQALNNYSSCKLGTIFSNRDSRGAAFICRQENGQPVPFGDVWQEQNNSIFPVTADINQLRVSIGSSVPLSKLTLEDDGSLLSQGVIGQDTLLPASGQGAGTRLLWYQRKSALRAGRVTGSQWDDVNIGDHTIAFGFNNAARTQYSAVLGGENNSVNTGSGQRTAMILGGKNNIITPFISSQPSYSVIAGGESNTVHGAYTFAAGTNNMAGGISTTNSQRMTIAGRSNRVDGTDSIISGGENNYNIGTASTINGGYQNTIFHQQCDNCTVTGGRQNAVTQSFTLDMHANNVTGGKLNQIQNTAPVPMGISSINGGVANMIYNASGSVISGGAFNRIGFTSMASLTNSISGGYNNRIEGSRNSILGGMNNYIATGVGTGEGYSTIAGGNTNTVSSNYVTLLGGTGTQVAGRGSLVFGNNLNVSSSARNSFVWGFPAVTTTINTPDNFLIYTGRVGIHHTAPRAAFELAGTNAATETYFSITDNIDTPGDRLVIKSAGGQVRVGIKNAAPIYPLHFGNDAHVDPNGNFIGTSSREMKQDIEELDPRTAKLDLYALNPVTYNFKSEPGRVTAGFIAEDMPDDLAVEGRNGIYELDILAVLAKVAQDHQQKIESQQTELQDLAESLERLQDQK